MKCRKYPTCVIFLKSQGSKDIKHDILDCQIHIYTNTNAQIHKYKFTKTQIHKYSIWQNDRNTQHMLYFWTAGGSRMSKMIIPSVLIRDIQLTFARSHQVYNILIRSLAMFYCGKIDKYHAFYLLSPPSFPFLLLSSPSLWGKSLSACWLGQSQQLEKINEKQWAQKGRKDVNNGPR